MAKRSWIETRTKHSRRIVWRENGKKRSISLGSVRISVARQFQTQLESLLEANHLGTHLPSDLIDWVNSLTDAIRLRMSELGLLPSVMGYTLKQWLDHYIEHRKGVSEETKIKWRNTKTKLIQFLGGETLLHQITAADAESFREHLKQDGKSPGVGLADSTVNRHCGIASQFFTNAMKARHISENPFTDVETSNVANKSREYFVTREEAEALIDALPNYQLRTLVALSRFGGLRCPSEAIALKWEHVHFGTSEIPGFILVSNVKTRHHTNMENFRKVPIFPELLPFLEQAWELATEGAVYVLEGILTIDDHRFEPRRLNLRGAVEKARARAGLTEWPRLMQNLRSSRETELVEQFPAHVVAYWMNHSTRIAQKHYLQVTDDHYHRATSYEVSPPTVAWSSEKNFVGAQVGATSHVLASQSSTPALVANRPPLENSAFRDSDRQATTRKMPQVGDEGLELWCSKAFIYRSNVRAGHFSGGAGGGAHAT